MKLTLDFDKVHSVKISSSDDSKHCYRLAWLPMEKTYALWYDDEQFVWVKHYDNVEEEIGIFVTGLLRGMKDSEIRMIMDGQ